MTGKPFGLVEWYDKLSGSYDELYGSEQLAKHQRVLGLLDGQGFGLAVDVACGTGMLLQKLRGRCNYSVGVDVSRRMLEIARGKTGLEEVGWVRADCRALPLKDGVADLLLAVSLVEAGSGSRGQVWELARTTAPGGRLVMTIFHPEEAPVDPGNLGLDHVTFRVELSGRESLFQAERPESLES